MARQLKDIKLTVFKLKKMHEAVQKQAESELFAFLQALQEDSELLGKLKGVNSASEEAVFIQSEGFKYQLIEEAFSGLGIEDADGWQDSNTGQNSETSLLKKLEYLQNHLQDPEENFIKSKFINYRQVIQSLAGGTGSSWTKSITQAADQVGDDASDICEQTSSAVTHSAQAIDDTGMAALDGVEGKKGSTESEISKSENNFKESVNASANAATDISHAENEVVGAVGESGLVNQTEKLAENTAGQTLSDLGKATIDAVSGNKNAADNELNKAGNSAVGGLDSEDKLIAEQGENELKAGTDNGELFKVLNFGQNEGLGSFLQKNIYYPAMNALQSFGNTSEADRVEAFKQDGDTLKEWGEETYEFAKNEPKEISEMGSSAIEAGENWAEFGLSMGTDKKAESQAKQDDIQMQTDGVKALDDADKETFTTFDDGMAVIADTSDGVVGSDTGKAADMAIGLIPGVGEAVMAGEVVSYAAEVDYNHNMKNQYENEEKQYQQEMQQYNESSTEGRERDEKKEINSEQELERGNSGVANTLSLRESSSGERDSREIRINPKNNDSELYDKTLQGERYLSSSGKNESREVRSDKIEGKSELYSDSVLQDQKVEGDQVTIQNQFTRDIIPEQRSEQNIKSRESNITEMISDTEKGFVAERVEMGDGTSTELSDSARAELNQLNTRFIRLQKNLERDFGSGDIGRREYEDRTIDNTQVLLKSQAKIFPRDARQYEIGSTLLSLFLDYQRQNINEDIRGGIRGSTHSQDMLKRYLESNEVIKEDKGNDNNMEYEQNQSAVHNNQALDHIEEWVVNTCGAGIAQLTLNLLASKSQELATKLKSVLIEKANNELDMYEDDAVTQFSDSCDRAYANFQDWMKGEGTTENRDKVEEAISKRGSVKEKTEEPEESTKTNNGAEQAEAPEAEATTDRSNQTNAGGEEPPPPSAPSEPAPAPEGGDIVIED